jgi:hypothetical protein
LTAAGVTIRAVKDNVVEARPELHKRRVIDEYPDGAVLGGYDEYDTFDTLPAFYFRDTKEVVIATSGKYTTGSYDVVLHELGHAYDHIFQDRLSRGGRFMGALQKEIKGGGYSTYLTLPREAFAESFAQYYAQAPNYQKLAPHYWAYWQGGGG